MSVTGRTCRSRRTPHDFEYIHNPGGYVNFMTDYELDRVRAAYGAAKCQRLAGIKRTWDPDNIFHRNANIQPVPADSQTSAEADIGASS